MTMSFPDTTDTDLEAVCPECDEVIDLTMFGMVRSHMTVRCPHCAAGVPYDDLYA